MVKSVFAQSFDTFGDPAKLLSVFTQGTALVLPLKQNLSFKELGDTLVEAASGGSEFSITRPSTPSGSPWERLVLSEEYVRVAQRFPAIASVEVSTASFASDSETLRHFKKIAKSVTAELSVDLSKSATLDAFTRHVAKRLASPVLSVQDLLVASESRDLQAFPLLSFARAVLQSSTPIETVRLLADHGVSVCQISLLCEPIREKARTDIYTASRLAEISWPAPILQLCERRDLLLQRATGNHSTGDKATSAKCQLAAQSLESWRPSDLAKLSPSVGVGEADQLRQRALLTNAQRVVSRQIGRAAIRLGSAQSEPEPLNLSGKFLSVGVVSLDLSLFPVEALHWPEFHNGVASALSPAVSRESVVQHRTKTEHILSAKRRLFGVPPELVPLATYRHAGFVFASHLLGLNRTIMRLDETYTYLKQQNECVSVAVILGQSVAARKSQNSEAGKLCLLHIPAQAPTQTELDIPLVVQSAALAGLGFVFAESNSRTVLETLLAELGRKPVGDKSSLEREAVAFSAGFGLGLVCLGTGPDVPSDVRLAERLADLIDSSTRTDATTLSDNSARVSLLLEDAAGLNRSVTQPGACVALALAYFNTSDLTAAERIKIPKTVEQLELQVRPDSLLFKFFARSAVMLSDVEPSIEWLESQLPTFLKDPLVLEFRETRRPGAETASAIDWLAVYQARMYALTGAAVALAVKFAGSQNGEAKAALVGFLKKLTEETTWATTHCAAQAASRPAPSMAIDRGTIETCRAAVLLGLATVMAGSEDPEVLKLCHQLRDAADEITPHGVSQAVNTALGFLFLGGGRMTFASSSFAAACITAAILPRYAASVSDNRSSLQALRHLFVLAAEERAVDVIDVGTMAKTSGVPVILTDTNGGQTKAVLPCSLPRGIATIQVQSDRYFDVTLRYEEVGNVVYVQRRRGKQSHASDPSGNLNCDRAYISEYSEPCESQVRKLFGLSLGSGLSDAAKPDIAPTSREDWRLAPSEIAAAACLKPDMKQRLSELLLERMEDLDSTVSEKYAHILLKCVDEGRRLNTIRLMDRCIKEDRLDAFLDRLEFAASPATPTTSLVN